MTIDNKETITKSSGNIFEDLGLSNPVEREAKAHVAIYIENLIKRNKWTQAQAAEHMSISQPDVSNIIRGRLSTYTLDRLFRCLNAAEQDVEITIRPSHNVKGLVTVGCANGK